MTRRARHRAGEPGGARKTPRLERKLFHVLATEQGVRAGLADMRDFLGDAGFDADACGTAEIVLAEALNNIAEHAFAATEAGVVRVTLTPGHHSLTAQIVDTGTALPELCPPSGQLPPLRGTKRSLPEGGFGWFLIRTLTECLCYTRHADENHLCLHISFFAPGTDAARSDR
ncbi:MAG TPA: ATP-binding protein [Roseovarius sp.]